MKNVSIICLVLVTLLSCDKDSSSKSSSSDGKSNNSGVEKVDVCKCKKMAAGAKYDIEKKKAFEASEEGKACAEAMKDEEVVKAAAEACPERKQDPELGPEPGPEDMDLNPCSCVERAIDIINRVSSMEEMNTLDQAIMREIPECNNIMERGDAQDYLNRNCPDAEIRMMKAGQSKVEELGLLDLE